MYFGLVHSDIVWFLVTPCLDFASLGYIDYYNDNVEQTYIINLTNGMETN